MYISALDNPNISLEMALRYFQNNELLDEIEKEVLELNDKNNFNPVLNERLESRLIQILFLTDNLPDDYMGCIKQLQKAIFKMALPHHRISLEADHPFERNTCIHYLNYTFDSMFDCYNGKYESSLKLNVDPFTSEGKASIIAISSTIAWSCTPVGRSIYNNIKG